MNGSKVHQFADELATKGTIMLKGGDRFLTEEELATLEEIAEALPRERVEVGDAGEPNSLDVSRFMTDVEMPQVVNAGLAQRGVDIVSQPHLLDYYKKLLRVDEPLFVRRMQYNILHENSFVGYHLDTDSNPDYIVAIVIQFGKDFSGGDYVVCGGDMPPRRFSPTNRSIIVSNCNFPHEVTKVEKGRRKSLVYFLAPHAEKNRRVPGTSLYERAAQRGQ